MIKNKTKDISDLNWALEIYSDIVKFGVHSSCIQDLDSCIHILIDYEEYEKCKDLSLISSGKSKGILEEKDLKNKILRDGKKRGKNRENSL